jgi:hypothetical protein
MAQAADHRRGYHRRMNRPRCARFLPCLLLAFAAGSAAAFDVAPWPPPAPEGSAQPNLTLAPDGRLWLSWIERRDGGGHRLRLAAYDAAGEWRAPATVAEGRDWFVNWADFPAVAALPDGSLWAHTLVKSAEATYAYDVKLHRSADGGASWSGPVTVHDDGTHTEHGFVSLWPWSHDRIAVAWLDGRATAGGHQHNHPATAGGGGAMQLRAAVFDADLSKRVEWPLDLSTCDCCQTAAAVTARGPVLAYRGRAQGEVRDILVTRHEDGDWTTPAKVHDDGWVMPACPVNGPALAARGEDVWVAWYTAAGGPPAIRLAHSRDAGDRFGPMREVARGGEVLGRVALAAAADGVWLAWLQEQHGRQTLWLARFSADLTRELARGKIADVAGRGRGTGFPRLALREGVAHLVWTEIVDGVPRLRGARVRAD